MTRPLHSPLSPRGGLCTLKHGGKSLTFRTNPNSITWKYVLNTKTENTYGGRVIQLLSTKIDDLTVIAECGNGGWEYMRHVAVFFRDLLQDQRKGKPAVFEYTTRGWKLHVFATGIPFNDSVSAVSRQFQMNFKVQEDVSGLMSSLTLGSALARLQDGLNFKHNQYNDPKATDQKEQYWGKTALDQGAGSAIGQLGSAFNSLPSLPQNPLSGLFGHYGDPQGNTPGTGDYKSLFPLGVGAPPGG